MYFMNEVEPTDMDELNKQESVEDSELVEDTDDEEDDDVFDDDDDDTEDE